MEERRYLSGTPFCNVFQILLENEFECDLKYFINVNLNTAGVNRKNLGLKAGYSAGLPAYRMLI